MVKFLRITLVAAILWLAFPAPRAEAFDPVTLAVLAPVALQLAQAARPYLIRAAVNTGRGMLKVGKDVFEILYLPYGLFKMSFGAPFGGFRSGLVYSIKGLIAPGKMVFHTLLLPVYMVGINVNL